MRVALESRDRCDEFPGYPQLSLLSTPGNSGAEDHQDQWVAVLDVFGSLRINGEAVPLGLRVLRDRDAIQIGDGCAAAASGGMGVMFFSTQSTPVVTPLAGEKAVVCARCRKKIQPGTLSVRCPACGAIHHQTSAAGAGATEQLMCWTYHTRCARCQREATALDDCEAWTPQEL
jgi:hypothetical protein